MSDSIQLSALDHHFASFVNGLDSTPGNELWLAAALTSAATAQGHVCLDLAGCSDLIVQPFHPGETLRTPTPEAWQLALAGCSTVGRPGDYVPLVLDHAGRLYLHRSWNYERIVAEGILARSVTLPFDRALMIEGLTRHFPSPEDQLDWQRIAAVAAATRLFTTISGGPGTGKTTTVARILALLIEQAGRDGLRIALAAPTGKAALRLGQSIQLALRSLKLSEVVRGGMPEEVQTIHRLLGVIPGSTGFRHNREHPLDCDVLVVDEVSMVDLPLMARLLEALPVGARLILLGDRDQLASVDAGAVLADICNHGRPTAFSETFRALLRETCTPFPGDQAAAAPPAPLADAVIHLRSSYRFGDQSGIGILSRLVNDGEAAAALDLLQAGTHDDLLWRPLPTGTGLEDAFETAVMDGYGAYAQATTPEQALQQLERFRVLSPYREGNGGVAQLNRLAEHALGLRRQEGQGCSRLPVMVTGQEL